MTTEQLDRDQKSLLLYLESCAVDKSGRLENEKLNAIDMENLDIWKEAGFLEWGRICYEDVTGKSSFWCQLSEDAISMAHKLRWERIHRLWGKRTWKTTEEKRSE